MNRSITGLIAKITLAAALLIHVPVFAFQAKNAPKSAKAAVVSAPSDKDIADAKAKGLVWVNTSTKVYHKDGQYYGNTVHGKFMTEADAQKAGYRAAQT